MSRPAVAFVKDGNLIRKMPVEWDGTALVEKKRRRRYIVFDEPYLMTEKAGFGTRAVNVFFTSASTTTTWDPDVMRKWREHLRAAVKAGKIKLTEAEIEGATPEGETVPAPDWSSVVMDEDPETGIVRPYRVTPEYVFEQSDAADIRAWNQQQAQSKTMLWLAAGAGAAGMVMLYFVFQLVKGTSFFGHS